MNTTAKRPTEIAAIGRTKSRQLPTVDELLRLRYQAARKLDRYFTHQLAQALAGGKLGAP